jgi:hypothetical protein
MRDHPDAMDDSARDYYDIPTQWIPSSNFANRPASEIEEINLDGLKTFMSSSESSVSSSEAGDIRTPTSREVPELTRRGPGPTIIAPQPRSSRSSNDVEALDRSIMREKAATAPAGGFSRPSYAPQPPRRAVSTRLGLSNPIRGWNPQREDQTIDTLTLERALVHERAGPHIRLPSPPHPRAQDDSSLLWNGGKLLGSFSQRTRVRKTVDDKNLGRLITDIVDFESQRLLSSPRSMMNTPRELYAIPEKRAAVEGPTSPSSPHAKDARRSIMSSLSGKGSSLHLKNSRHQQQHTRTLKMYPEGWQPIYLPGTICLEKHPAQLRKDSVASLDPFAKEIEPRVRRHSDLVVLDSITAFFDDFGVMEDATEVCLDMFWRDAYQVPRLVADTRRSSIMSVEEPQLSKPETLQRPPSARSLRGSRFSFSSASSTTSMPRNGTRDKLKRLLSPAFPGSGFLRTPAAPKEQESQSDIGPIGDAISTFSASSTQKRDKQRLDKVLQDWQ